LRQGDLAQWIHDFDRAFESPIHWRWGSLITVLQWILEIETKIKHKKTRKRRGSTEASTDRASDLLAKIEAEMPWSEHWECRNCRRVVDAMTGCLKVSGRRAGAFLADEAAVSVSQRCFDLSEKLEERQTLFDEMRDDFQRMVMKPLKPARKKAVLEAPTPLLANVLTVCGQQLVDKSFAQGKYVKVPTAQNSTSTIQRRGIAAQTDASISPTPTSPHQHYTSLPCAPTHPLTHPPTHSPHTDVCHTSTHCYRHVVAYKVHLHTIKQSIIHSYSSSHIYVNPCIVSQTCRFDGLT